MLWFNPRSGGALQVGSVATVSGPGIVDLGQPPRDANEDWAVDGIINAMGKRMLLHKDEKFLYLPNLKGYITYLFRIGSLELLPKPPMQKKIL